MQTESSAAETATEYVATKGAAKIVGLSSVTLEQYRGQGTGPPYYKPPGVRRVLYRVDELKAWVESGRRSTARAA